ncbi:3D domain-containing protein [Bacillus tuaregi]|uniref:3D domain-containing protein n=1 Tax=Bacillus tuaregi TaxID=1816695 RepID=UPI0008F807D5|nr:LysM peptidoglycan-binding domain-containing protein [Bacillus tuaregi]
MKRKWLSALAATTFILVGTNQVQAEQIVVEKGDTLWGIAQENKVTVESIKEWNQLSSDIIHPDDLLEVSPIIQLLVTKGDTLWDISQMYGVSVDDIKKWNELSSDLIHPGLDLKIHTAEKLEEYVTEKAVSEANSTVENAPKPAPEQAATTEPVVQAEVMAEPEPQGKEIMVEATAYTAECEGCSGITKTGVDLKTNPDAKVIAVDPAVIPLGSKVHVEGYGFATAEDIGGAIDGNEIDVYVKDHQDALQWGRKEVKVTILD